jgi:hypothetical protein
VTKGQAFSLVIVILGFNPKFERTILRLVAKHKGIDLDSEIHPSQEMAYLDAVHRFLIIVVNRTLNDPKAVGSQSNEILQFNAGALDNAMQLREKFFDLRDRAAQSRRVK